MNNERIEELLLKLLGDMAEVKAKLDSIEKQEFGSRIDRLEADSREHAKTIKSLENRNNTMEAFVRNNLNESNKTTKGVFISAGLAIFSALTSLVVNLLF